MADRVGRIQLRIRRFPVVLGANGHGQLRLRLFAVNILRLTSRCKCCTETNNRQTDNKETHLAYPLSFPMTF
jgi:hypothetical protein